MANVQRGDVRQVFTQAVSKPADFSPVVNSVNNLINTGISVQQMADESKMANYQINLANEALELNTKINTKYQADPTNPEREREFQEGFSLLADKYKVSAVSQGKWGQIKNGILNNYKTYNTKWQIQQQQTNAQVDLKNGYEALIEQISMMGKNNASIDEVRLVYNNGINGLRNGATAVLGEVVTGNFLKDIEHDYMTSYISGLAMDNPLQAQALMKDQGVLNDIGNAETIEKLNNYITTSLMNQHKKTAVAELSNSLRALNSQEADDLLNGKANINQLMQFNQKFKNISNGSKEMLYSIYGISTKNKFYYDANKKTIEEAKSSDGGESLGNLKMTNEQKIEIADTLETDLHNMLTMFEENPVEAKKLKTSNERKKGEEVTKGYMDTIAFMQGRIDTAYAAKAITKDERSRLMNDFIMPATDYLEKNLEQLDQGAFLKGGLGYDRIKKEFNTEDLKGRELQEMQREKLFAQNYYLDELHKVVQKTPNLKSIYDIERLSPKAQKEIYDTASQNALKRARRWTNRPDVFFAKEYPQYYSAPFKMFGADKALMIIKNAAEDVYKAEYEGVNDRDLLDIADSKMREYINNEARKQKYEAQEILSLQAAKNIRIEKPKNVAELEKRIKDLGVTREEFFNNAYERGLLKSRLNPNYWIREKSYDFYDLSNALAEIELAKQLEKGN